MATTYELIAKSVLGSAAANIDFTSIPATYDDLLVLGTFRGENAVRADAGIVLMNINGVSTNRSQRRVLATSSSASSATFSTAYVGITGGTSGTSNTFSSLSIYIPNYAGSTNKSFSVDNVSEANDSTYYVVEAVAGLWSSTAAIDQLTFSLNPGGNLAAGSSVYLYGITKS